ncbi:MAG: dihydropteroate synthase [Synergistaceae bacterium]|jgi:dihydropteroate synthase|nr:dihydropteroate synthase [Synergistaceae bacterium]
MSVSPVSVSLLNIRAACELEAVCARIGADPRSSAYFQPKRRTEHLYIRHVDFRAAAFLKQELLARGGDAVVGRHVIDGQVGHSDVLLIATGGQLRALLQKLKAMDCWGLKELREALTEALNNASVSGWTLSLPRGRELRLDDRTKVMGILNLTEDSFYPASRLKNLDDLLRRAETMLEDGADVLDVGAESTRPGSLPLGGDEELARLVPALRALRNAFPDAVLSVDTYKGKVALEAAREGADIINDVGGFGLDADMLACAAGTGLPCILSHIRGTPADMQHTVPYDDLLGDIDVWFREKMATAEHAGLARERLVLDPGLGFGKRGEDNLLILKEAETLSVFGRPVLIGHSRKKFTGTATGAESADDRLAGTLAVSALLEGRVQMIRVHDVKENRRALAMARAVREASSCRS